MSEIEVREKIKLGSEWRSVKAPEHQVTVVGLQRRGGEGWYVELRYAVGRSSVFSVAGFLHKFTPVPVPPATPPHYDFAIEPIDAIRAWGLNFALGNVVKYVARAGRKGPAIDDLRKARDYLDHEIKQVEGGRP